MTEETKTPVTFVCVNVGTKYPMEYVAILRDMLHRNTLPDRERRFLCVTDRPDELPEGVEPVEPEPDLPGWWQKIALFKPGKLPEGRIVYFDLDVAITGELDTLIDQPGIIRDWHLPTYNSSVMVWDTGEHAEAWERFTPDVVQRLRGDQDWLSEVGGWETFPEGWCVSFRSHAQQWPPAGARVICFHGRPKPHEVTSGWVPAAWKIGGLTSLPKMRGMNVATDDALENVRSACARDGMNWFTGRPQRPGEICLVGGSPSVREHIADIRRRVARGAGLVSMNGSLKWLLDRRFVPTSHVLLDARPDNVQFLDRLPKSTFLLLASQCHPDVFDRAQAQHPDDKIILWHASISAEMEDILRPYEQTRPICLVGGGCTVGLRAMYLAHISGFRRIHCYGMDSSYSGEAHHAFPQALNDNEDVLTVMMGGNAYRCSAWMARQANEFNEQHEALAREGTRVWVHGTGLLPDMCRILNDRAWRQAA